MSPRRSSRARQTQQPLRNNTNQSASSSSTSSNKMHRPARANSRPEGLVQSVTPGSSSEEPDRHNQPTELDTRQTRQKKREQDTLDGVYEVVPFEPRIEDEEADDGEVTRCICGLQDYPGPPEHVSGTPCVNHRNPDNPSKSNPDAPLHPLLFESGSLFIQCETCHVWQHGGCVGIMDEAMSPEHYYCEECREPLHKIYVEPSGRKYSKYTRAYQDWECTRPSVTSKKSIYYETQSVYHLLGNAERATPAAISSAKRRSTMNSRAAADEEEALLKAIEESKSDGKSTSGYNGVRRAKRGREDSSEEAIQELKRRKTGSDSGSPNLRSAELAAAPGSDTEPGLVRSRSGNLSRKVRGASSQAFRDGMSRDRERDRDGDRLDTLARRKGKVEKLRGDEAELVDDVSRATDLPRSLPAVSKTATTQSMAKTQLGATVAATAPVNRRGVKAGTRRGRGGRNQYTRERDAGADSKHESRGASHSRDSEDVGNSDGHAGNTLVNGAKPSKPRHMNPNRTSMNDLRKRVAGILEYITRTQVEMAGDKTSPEQQSRSSNPITSSATASLHKGRDGRTTRAKAWGNGESASEPPQGADMADKKLDSLDEPVVTEGEGTDETLFKGLTSLEMMDVLTRELVVWQKVHGKWGER